jgi:hypothetical protein
MIKFLADWLWTDTRPQRWLRYRINRYRISHAGSMCHEPGLDHGGVRSNCWRPRLHLGRHCDMWGDKW